MDNILEQKINYPFKTRSLLMQALIHSSYANETKMCPLADNERLEFLGDAVLELTVSEYIFNTYPELSEGELTKLRASVVCEPMLAKLARAIDLGGFLKMGRGEDLSGGRNRDSILSDALEALLGAVYKDSSFAEAKALILRLLQPEITRMRGEFKLTDGKTYLQEKLQQTSKAPIEYTVVSENGPDHNKIFVVQVKHGGRTLGTGEGRNKKDAEQKAAVNAIKLLESR
ncbi:MAG: ribonuclease III [Clostridiales bacterium]|nr:ribonuclease III [Clostridiales bacterium]